MARWKLEEILSDICYILSIAHKNHVEGGVLQEEKKLLKEGQPSN